MTEWKPVIGHPNYVVSSEGELYNQKTEKDLKGHIRPDGYVRIKMNNKGYLLHRVVATHFVPNPENKKEVNHLGDKTDNRACMLEWSTRVENATHAGKHRTKFRAVAVQQIDLETNNVVKEYDRIIDAEQDGFISQNVHMCINGKISRHKGYGWRRKNPKVNEEDLYDDEDWVYLKDSVYDTVSIYTKYQVSNYGRVRGWYKRILKPNRCNKYESIKLTDGKKTRSWKIHRLVLMAFNVPNPENKAEVDHIDSDCRNNRLSNLRWATRAEQCSNPNTLVKFYRPKDSKN
jgi:hypothetical protein